jgi:thiamine-monophosphate kinase
MAIGEFDLIRKYFTGIGPVDAVALAGGDDCALLDVPAGQQLATSVDTLVADVHFPAQGEPGLIAQKALRCNLSDLAACGAQPLGFTLALTLPDADENWLGLFACGLRACADEFTIPLIGGDTTRGPVRVITIGVFGGVPRDQALLRSGAQPGDFVYVSGMLGDARAALDLLATPVVHLDEAQRFWLKRYYMPRPRVALGMALRGIASSAIDISDGLAADLAHILERSDAGAIIDIDALPLSDALREHPQASDFALHGGDDYELCFTVPASRVHQLEAIGQQLQIRLTQIGVVTEQSSLQLRAPNGDVTSIAPAGYRHF